MCGHGIIGIATVAVETGMVPSARARDHDPDRHAGGSRSRRSPTSARAGSRRAISATCRRTCWRSTRRWTFRVWDACGSTSRSAARSTRTWRPSRSDCACVPDEYRRLIETGMAIKRAVASSRVIRTRSSPIWGSSTGRSSWRRRVARTSTAGTCACSPRARWTGHRRAPVSRVVSRCTTRAARSGEHERIEIESIIGTRFTGRVVETTTFGPYRAVIPEVAGSAYITGRHEFLIAPGRSPARGFLLR